MSCGNFLDLLFSVLIMQCSWIFGVSLRKSIKEAAHCASSSPGSTEQHAMNFLFLDQNLTSVSGPSGTLRQWYEEFFAFSLANRRGHI
jgi:hypothetical protein